MITKKDLIKIAKENPNGFTVNIITGELVNNGIAVAKVETQGKTITDFDYVLREAKKTMFMGGWLDTNTGIFYLDATMLFDDMDLAKQSGIQNNQIAVFDLNNQEEIRL